MEDKEQFPPLQVPSEENNYKHIDTPENENTGANNASVENVKERSKNEDTGSDKNASADDVLQKEKLIDPGNEHQHNSGENTRV